MKHCILAAVMFVMFGTAQGGVTDIHDWISNSHGSWHDANNWNEGEVPEDGDEVFIGFVNSDNGIEDIDIDNGGAGVFLPNSSLTVRRKITFKDASANGDPQQADDALVFDTISFNGIGGVGVTLNVPFTARRIDSRRHGAVINREFSVKEIHAKSEHQDHWEFNASPIGAVNFCLIDENRGPDGGDIDGSLSINAPMEIRQLNQVWGRLRVRSNGALSVDQYRYFDYTDQAENNNINPINVVGDLLVNVFTVFNVALGEETTLPAGTYGRIDHPTAENQLDFIVGDGVLTVLDDQPLFKNTFESEIAD